MTSELEANLGRVRARIDAAARRSGRRGEDVVLVAVTKSVAPEFAADLVRLGQIDLGESRADELARKHESLLEAGLHPRWHFIGHLQRNKVGRVVALADAIHSIDSARLLESVDCAAGAIGRRPAIWIQVKLSAEPTKGGLSPDEVAPVLRRAAALSNVEVAGLMTLAPLVAGTESGAGNTAEIAASARPVFRDLANLARELARTHGMGDALSPGRLATSMGMSGDFECAVEEGSDLVRIGSLLFEGCPGGRPGTQGTPR